MRVCGAKQEAAEVWELRGQVEPRPEITVLCEEVRTGWWEDKRACAVSPSVGTGRELGWEPVC